MTTKRIRTALLLIASAVAMFAAGSRAQAQAEPGKSGNPLVDGLLQRLEKVESELAKLKSQKHVVPADPKDQKIMMMLETPYLGASQYGRENNESRFFAAKLMFINLTPGPITVKRDDISLELDNNASFPLKPVTGNVQYQSFQVGDQTYQLSNLTPANELKVQPGLTASTWVAFTDLPGGNQTLQMRLKAKIAGKDQQLNVNEFAMGMLGIEVERIGPRRSLALLLTISGPFNTVNMSGFVDLLDKLTTEKVGRVVVRWAEASTPLDPQVYQWLQQAAYQAGLGEKDNASNGNEQQPTIPAGIRELHLAKVPSSAGGDQSPDPTGSQRVHKSDVEAVSAALKTAYEVLPQDELLREIESGHPLTRAAALANGGGRLPEDKLPVLLRYADDKDPAMQRAALIALRHFGDPQAVDKLLYFVRKNAEPLATTAIESLAASRFAIAQKGLLEILANESPESKRTIVKVLARYPRPMWSATIYEFASDPRSEVAAEALTALARIGHPQLLDAFRRALAEGNDALKAAAFAQLAQRTDAQSEELAMSYILEKLKNTPPDATTTMLLNRTKDHRAVPLLLAQMKKNKDNRTAIVNTLSQIGDQSVVQEFVTLYPSLVDHEKSTVLTALAHMKSPEFRRLAKEALASGDDSLVNTACQGLQSDGSTDAVQMLIDVFKTTANQSTQSYVSTALGTLGTPAARNALLEARNSEDTSKRQYAINALRNLRYRSPGMNLVHRANYRAREQKWDEAIKEYTLAIKLDADLPEAFTGRGNALIRLNKYGEAKNDYIKARELDPFDSQAVTGAGLCLVIEGSYEEGIKIVEESRATFKDDQLFAYNAACVYGRAVSHLNKDEKIPDRAKKLEQFQKKAIEDLQSAVKLGFADFKWMQEDPDLTPLHELPGFKSLYSPVPGAPAKPNPNAPQPPRAVPKG